MNEDEDPYIELMVTKEELQHVIKIFTDLYKNRRFGYDDKFVTLHIKLIRRFIRYDSKSDEEIDFRMKQIIGKKHDDN